MQQVNIGLDILGFLMASVILICVLYERYLSKTKANNFIGIAISSFGVTIDENVSSFAKNLGLILFKNFLYLKRYIHLL